ncbi:MAG: hypothetical protein M1832_003888 [Thelocarpon impressellum]|nr:MAG: hypothetical protein M1832_003888 [Thelocarpon impressellum]
MEDFQPDLSQEIPPSDVFVAPSIIPSKILSGDSYTHFSPLPEILVNDPMQECVLGVDEAGRGPVLGPMVYGVFYLPTRSERPLLSNTHHFDDSKVLTPATRSALMRALCAEDSDLHDACGWATSVLSARAISAAMLGRAGTHNLNAQAQAATVALISGVLARGVRLSHIYVDTVGPPASYQARLARFFPTVPITVAKKADSLYPCVSAASVCAKVTRDAALEAAHAAFARAAPRQPLPSADGWGSGYPSDARCAAWLRRNLDPVFGWGSECRFSWSTAKDMLEADGVTVDWPVADEEEGEDGRVTDYFASAAETPSDEGGELGTWFGARVDESIF